jgi:hypothetical protein
MNETTFVPLRAIRATDGGFRHEKHETSIEVVLSCLPSCTTIGGEEGTRIGTRASLKAEGRGIACHEKRVEQRSTATFGRSAVPARGRFDDDVQLGVQLVSRNRARFVDRIGIYKENSTL